ncbi:hypothetical protein [Fusibacter ferrireducens]|uniref:DUF1292 domain-containing protein n=1 Tax=Fusibacter ferrireducens TaxID=2785058 RepID=A0ABR9ZWR0_9FIRM|nr:hypothetical protein [Fusibacter ferrireducens]MBF4694054.1 hypothetical protein [Fusibacter ferrireducens]
MKSQIESEVLPEKIEAEVVTIEVKDTKTGKIYKREVPLLYKENDNGIILCGEDSKGQKSEIVFLSDVAIEKMMNFMGKGPDHSHHDHSEHDHSEHDRLESDPPEHVL